MATRLPRLPQLLDRKIYKTGQTRGADDDVIYQNRVARNSTILISYPFWSKDLASIKFENGYIVLISPATYFEDKEIRSKLSSQGLKLGKNLLVFYETRQQWEEYNPEKKGWKPATSRISPLGGQYVARVPATTAFENGSKILRGFTETSNKGAGIRAFEYASSSTIKDCRDQLEALFWLCSDSEAITKAAGMTSDDIVLRKKTILEECKGRGLLDLDKLMKIRVINKQGKTICPLCLEELSGAGFISRLEQAEGREVPDLTVTQVNLFHIKELRINTLNHKPNNLGWGHHHCNVVTKDSGIDETLRWMSGVLQRNIDAGYLESVNKVD